jgi:hypothetical protein
MTTSFSKVEYSFLSSLGLTFDEAPIFNIGPEAGLIHLLDRENFIGNYMYGMLKLFLKYNHEYLRVDLLLQLEKKLTPIGRTTLSALAAYCSKDLNDKRFKKIKKYKLHEPIFLNSQEYVDSVGAEPFLIDRGIVIKTIPIQNEKKTRPSSWILKNNVWFKNRLLFGLGVRADAFSALQTNHIKTYYELSKILGASLFSARKNYLDFKKINEISSAIFPTIGN